MREVMFLVTLPVFDLSSVVKVCVSSVEFRGFLSGMEGLLMAELDPEGLRWESMVKVPVGFKLKLAYPQSRPVIVGPESNVSVSSFNC